MKDPAVLWYTADFLTGTITMTDEQVGKYARLLCLQHQQGGFLTEEDMLNICKTYDKKIFSKFIKTGDGLYYNERMRVETERRKNYSKSRRSNRLGNKSESQKNKNSSFSGDNICSSYDKHMEIEINNINNILTSLEGGVGGTFLLSYDELSKILPLSEVWIGNVSKSHKVPREKVLENLEAFILMQRAEKPNKRQLDEFVAHFNRWLRKKLTSEQAGGNGKPVLQKMLTYDELCDMAAKNMVVFSDYEKDRSSGLWKRKRKLPSG